MPGIFANIYDLLIFLFVLSVLIIVHEWGHFITAKKTGVEVKRFALGFGPKLFSRVFQGTEFAICLIPLGGYVKMSGDEKGETTGAEGEFLSKPPGKRALIILNGSVVNYIFAYVCLLLVFMIGHPGESTRVADVYDNGPSAKAGLRVGDKIIAVNGKRVYGWNNLMRNLEGRGQQELKIDVQREGKTLSAVVFPDVIEKTDILGNKIFARDLGIENVSNSISGVVSGYPAELAGLQKGDRIIEVNGVVVRGWKGIQKNIDVSRESYISVKIDRAGAIFDKKINPKIVSFKDEKGNVKESRKIGIIPEYEYDTFRFGFLESVLYSFDELFYITESTYKTILKLIVGSKTAREAVAGPVLIFTIVKGAAEEGVAHVIFIMGVISASLAIFNLLPVVPLDGGHLFLLGIEKIRGKPLSNKADEVLGKIGFALIIFLAVIVFFSDLSRIGFIDKVMGLFTK
ncbi:MAG: RIP metalloprotease RseP [Candidatus Omnitrophica bacterium]|nr:RIP metalloprotease RseP [Candidatus Omnitrophota bacterium]